MAEHNSIFVDGDNLQTAIGKSIQENKALLCFVSDDGEESTEWEVALLDESIQDGLLAQTVPLRLKAGSEQAGFLNSVCPISSWPSVVLIHRGQIIANWQHDQTSTDVFETHLKERFGPKSTDSEQSTSATETMASIHIDLPPSEGRMRLPNNAYDHFRTLTQRGQEVGLSERILLKTQLRWLAQMNIDIVTNAVNEIQSQVESLTEAPSLPESVLNRLLNTPATTLNADKQPDNSSPASSTIPSSSAIPASNSVTTSSPANGQSRHNRDSQSQSRQPPRATNQPASHQTEQSLPLASSTSQATQRADYISAQKAREAASKAERERVRSQVAADKKARREAEAARAAEQRRKELQELRKANSTTADPKATDVRLQVRLFDGSTIRSSFAHDATISKDVRGWIDNTIRTKAADSQADQPYNLKLILAPQPNRNIEEGEEDSALSDVEDINSSATMVMVPVRGYVESYVSTSGRGVPGLLGSAISGGVGLFGSAAGWAVGGLGRLIGGGGGTTPQVQSGESTEPVHTEASRAEKIGTAATGSSGSRIVRTLADQRRDEEDESRRRGNQLYNGMGLNVQPRRDEDEDPRK